MKRNFARNISPPFAGSVHRSPETNQKKCPTITEIERIIQELDGLLHGLHISQNKHPALRIRHTLLEILSPQESTLQNRPFPWATLHPHVVAQSVTQSSEILSWKRRVDQLDDLPEREGFTGLSSIAKTPNNEGRYAFADSMLCIAELCEDADQNRKTPRRSCTEQRLLKSWTSSGRCSIMQMSTIQQPLSYSQSAFGSTKEHRTAPLEPTNGQLSQCLLQIDAVVQAQ